MPVWPLPSRPGGAQAGAVERLRVLPGAEAGVAETAQFERQPGNTRRVSGGDCQLHMPDGIGLLIVGALQMRGDGGRIKAFGGGQRADLFGGGAIQALQLLGVDAGIAAPAQQVEIGFEQRLERRRRLDGDVVVQAGGAGAAGNGQRKGDGGGERGGNLDGDPGDRTKQQDSAPMLTGKTFIAPGRAAKYVIKNESTENPASIPKKPVLVRCL